MFCIILKLSGKKRAFLIHNNSYIVKIELFDRIKNSEAPE